MAVLAIGSVAALGGRLVQETHPATPVG